MFKDKEGNKLTSKEFFSRWKEGIRMVTPIQKAKAQRQALRIQLIGIISGLGIAVYNFKSFWWMALILLGALILTYLQYVGVKQQIKVFSDLEEQSETISINNLLDEIKED